MILIVLTTRDFRKEISNQETEISGLLEGLLPLFVQSVDT